MSRNKNANRSPTPPGGKRQQGVHSLRVRPSTRPNHWPWSPVRNHWTPITGPQSLDPRAGHR